MSGAHDINEFVDPAAVDPGSPEVLEYGREREAEHHVSTREAVEFGLMGLVYFLLPLLLLFVLQVVLT